MEAVKISENTTVEEFYSLPGDERYELIDGKLYNMAEPSRIHQELVSELLTDIKNHIRLKGGDCRVYPAPFGVRLSKDENTVLEPDITVICDKSKLTDKGCTGAPDWIIEIASPGNLSHDYIDKLSLYMKAEVKEYWIVNPESDSVVVYRLDNPFIPVAYTLSDTIIPGIYKDLSIDFKEIMDRISL